MSFRTKVQYDLKLWFITTGYKKKKKREREREKRCSREER